MSFRNVFLSASGTLAIALLAGANAPAAAEPPPAVHRAPLFNVVGKTITELADAQLRGQVTSLQLVDAYLDRIKRLDRAGPSLHSVLAINPLARAQARTLDRERTAGHVRGPLHGIPLLIKDNIETADPMPTTAGSLALAGNRGGRDAPLVARLRAAGAVILGKANLSEWANIRASTSISGWSAVGGQTRNPYEPNRSACGSSSGSGAAVAASLATAAIGTETDGSITCPGSVNGLVGLKPTVGFVPRTYVVPISHSQDTPGPIARTIGDAAILLAAIAGSDPADQATVEADAHKASLIGALAPNSLQDSSLQGVHIGMVRVEGAPPAVRNLYAAAARRFAAAGAVIVDVDLPAEQGKLGDMELTVMLTELKTDLNAYLATTPPAVTTRTLADVIDFNRQHAAVEMALFDQDLFERAQHTNGLQEPAYLEALATSRLAAGRDGIDKMLASQKLQVLIAPTMSPAFLIDPVNGDAIGWSGPGNLPAIAGYPHLTLPMGQVKGLPVGLSVIGPAWSDAMLLTLGAAMERQIGPLPRAKP